MTKEKLPTDYYSNDPEKLKQLLAQRDKFLVESGNWQPFVNWIATTQVFNPVGWETDAEWELECRAFHWNENWDTEATRELINDLWKQYCFAANPEREET